MDKDLLSLVQREVKGIIKDLALHDARLDAVEEKLQEEEKARREEIDKILETLVSIEKILCEELLRRVQKVEEGLQGVEEGLAATNIRVEELGQSVAKTDDKVEELGQSVAKTDDKVEELGRGFAKTDDRVEELGQGLERLEHEVKESDNEDCQTRLVQ